MKSNEIRQRFIDYYLSKEHSLVQSAPLVPQDDPTLLFTSAGMVQFKRYFSGAVKLPYRRAVTVQKCLRVTDIEEVGRTPRHDTFFEMLGHFSFGDYFKREAILWNWELFTKIYGMNPDLLTASVFETDDEAYQIWREEVGLPPERIVRLGAKDNFWGPAGGLGACGPCSELYYDLGPEVDADRPNLKPGDECNRYVEIGNFVFPQFDRQEDGSDLPLENRGIDTGIGLERVAMALQGKTSIFHTDLFWPMVQEASSVCGKPYESNEVPLNIIADHVRALTFAVGEGIMPANEGRGYVIRRLIRRAAVQGYTLGIERPFLFKLIGVVVEMMRHAYPEVEKSRPMVTETIEQEEIRFHATIDQGLDKLQDKLRQVGAREDKTLTGEEAFILYDTYGLPRDLICDVALGQGITIDDMGFDSCMDQQRERSRAAAKFTADTDKLTWTTVSEGDDSEFIGYESTTAEVQIRRFAVVSTDPLHLAVVFSPTPFYGESGGQLGDTGSLCCGPDEFAVIDAIHQGPEVWHILAPTAAGSKKASDQLADPDRTWTTQVQASRRQNIQRHHTATHLLHIALRNRLGDHVAQAGSLVAPDRLRFDYSHNNALSEAEIAAVEKEVNEAILANIPVSVKYSTYDEAIQEGVTALFGEKYDADQVRRVRIGEVSEELCGGTHVGATGEIGTMMIVEEAAVAAGTRRIEAVCGMTAVDEFQKSRTGLNQLRRLLGVPQAEMAAKIEALHADLAAKRKELSQVHRSEGLSILDELLGQVKSVAGGSYLVGEVKAESVDEFRALGDKVRQKLSRGAAVLCAAVGKKTSFLAVVTDDLVSEKKLRADQLVRQVAAVTGGGGGGKPHMALGGAADTDKVPEALEEAHKILRGALE
jgi:alanyl-tRNA synthetase